MKKNEEHIGPAARAMSASPTKLDTKTWIRAIRTSSQWCKKLGCMKTLQLQWKNWGQCQNSATKKPLLPARIAALRWNEWTALQICKRIPSPCRLWPKIQTPWTPLGQAISGSWPGLQMSAINAGVAIYYIHTINIYIYILYIYILYCIYTYVLMYWCVLHEGNWVWNHDVDDQTQLCMLHLDSP